LSFLFIPLIVLFAYKHFQTEFYAIGFLYPT
jgi:hypothetical protein